jgi:hypothetical protein
MEFCLAGVATKHVCKNGLKFLVDIRQSGILSFRHGMAITGLHIII